MELDIWGAYAALGGITLALIAFHLTIYFNADRIEKWVKGRKKRHS